MHIEYYRAIPQDGDLEKAMKHIAAKGSDAVAVKDMLNTLQSNHHAGMDELAKQFSEDKPKAIQDVRDVTTEFLVESKQQGCAMLSSRYILYRGLCQSLLGNRDKYIRNQQLGILAGNKDLVLDVILGTSVEEITTSPELLSRWDTLNYEIMGMVLFENQAADSMKHMGTMKKLFASVKKPLLLLIFGTSTEPSCWEFYDHEDDECEKFTRVDLDSRGKNRRKNADYRIIPVDQLGVTFEDEAAFLVSQAVCKQMATAVADKDARSQPKSSFKLCPVPPDGYCFWHSVLASLQPEKFSRIERSENGWAVNKRQEKVEAAAAKHLLQLAVDAGIDQSKFPHGYVDLPDIAMIAEKLNLAVRCTISDEVAE